MATWKPELASEVEVSDLDLDAEEGFLLSRLDGSTSVEELPFLTGLSRERVDGILERLVELGTVEPGVSRDGAAADCGAADFPGEPSPDLERSEDGNWRALFERELKPLEVDARVKLGREVGEERLKAFCYDPSPRVVSALLENQRFGLEHARLVAAHHRTGAGLDPLGRKAHFLRDRQVQRNLLRNPQTPQGLMARILQGYRLLEIYRLTAGRDAGERARSTARKQLRKRFSQSSAEERVQLILKTEGRCLPQLVGIALGGRATALLCRRPLASTLLVRNLARWPSTPPPVLQHLARQPAVRRSPMLRNEILRHPNAPSRLQNDLRP